MAVTQSRAARHATLLPTKTGIQHATLDATAERCFGARCKKATKDVWEYRKIAHLRPCSPLQEYGNCLKEAVAEMRGRYNRMLVVRSIGLLGSRFYVPPQGKYKINSEALQ